MNKKDEALKKCLRVLNPIADERMYETKWIDSAIYACHEALEEKEWQGLTDDEIKSIYLEIGVIDFTDIVKLIEQKLKEKNS